MGAEPPMAGPSDVSASRGPFTLGVTLAAHPVDRFGGHVQASSGVGVFESSAPDTHSHGVGSAAESRRGLFEREPFRRVATMQLGELPLDLVADEFGDERP